MGFLIEKVGSLPHATVSSIYIYIYSLANLDFLFPGLWGGFWVSVYEISSPQIVLPPHPVTLKLILKVLYIQTQWVLNS